MSKKQFIRVTPELNERLDTMAKARGIPMTELLTDLLTTYTDGPFPLEKTVRSDVVTAGRIPDDVLSVIEEEAKAADISINEALFQIIDILSKR